MIKLIIFDFDGTLGDTRRNIILTLRQTMQALGLKVHDEATCGATIGLRLEDGFRQLYPDLDETGIKECATTYRRLFDENKKTLVPALFPGVVETLSELQRRGLTMTIATSRSSKSLHEFLSDMGIAGYMSFIMTGDLVEKGKPDPEPVLKTLAALEADASETLVVGDMPVDILMGRGAGVKTCGVTWGNASRLELEAAGADFIIDSMSELPLCLSS